MFHLPTIKFWRNTGFVVLLLCLLFTLLGTFSTTGPIVYHWDTTSEPNASGGKWLLWAMLVLSVLSFFTTTSFTKPQLGQNAVNKETASALAIGLMSSFTGINIIIVIYAFYPFPTVPIVGTIGILLVFVLYLIIAVVQKKRSKS